MSNGGVALKPTTDDQAYYMLVPIEATGQSFSLIFIATDGSAVIKDINFTSPFVSNRIKTVKVYIDQNPALTNINIQRTGIISASITNIEQIKNGVHLSNNSALTYLEIEVSKVTDVSLNYNPNLMRASLSKVPVLKNSSAFYSKLTSLDFL